MRIRRIRRFALVVAAAATAVAAGWLLGARAARAGHPLVATFSIVAFDPDLGDLGIAVQSKFPNVRAVVPWAKAGVGAVATQSFSELDYGRVGLELLERGATAAEALAIVLRGDAGSAQRQVGIVDARGNAATWTGEDCFAWAGARIGREGAEPAAVGPESGGVGAVVTGRGYTAQGNILVSAATVDAMARAFESAEGELADRLLAALVAGGKAGGDRRGEQSAALLVVRAGAGYDGQDNFVDLSVYDHATPIAELVRLHVLNRLHFRGSRPENLIPVTPEIARELQEIWRERGFYAGEIDGVVDAELQKILVDFMGWENYDVRIAEVQAVDLAKGERLVIDREVLDDIRAVYRERRWKPRVDRP
ncbi:MAG TPA: DUF1028 domain-containing protein [Thermoanaerobaculia bacterium]|nr:DUF1028 domain-containing protein [Thermoanaerobaculia bacterium]